METMFKTGAAARRLGVTPRTLQRWGRSGFFFGGGLDFKRRDMLDLTDAITQGQVRVLVLAHRDRLTRFGYEWFEHLAQKQGCELLVLNQERLSPEQEMVQDMMTIVHCFSSRLYGLRNYRKQLTAALNRDAEHAAGAPHQD